MLDWHEETYTDIENAIQLPMLKWFSHLHIIDDKNDSTWNDKWLCDIYEIKKIATMKGSDDVWREFFVRLASESDWVWNV